MVSRKFSALTIALSAPLALMVAPITAQAQAPEYQAQAQANSDENTQRLNQRGQDIVAALNKEMPLDEVFDESFLKAVPEAQLYGLVDQLSGQFGPLTGVHSITPEGTEGGAKITLRFEEALAKGMIQLTQQEPYKVGGLRLTEFEPLNSDSASIVEDIRALSGEASIYFAKLGGTEPLLAEKHDQPFAIGSAFKLYVLSALTQSIAAGEHSWDDVVTLDQKSFASGMMQNWPQGGPITLHSLATLMISISDNTATDQLIAVLGREAVEVEVIASGHSNPALILPFMTTREMFTLKAGGGEALSSYVSSSESERRATLETLAGKDIDGRQVQATFANGPVHIDVEWLATAQDVSGIFTRLVDANDETTLAILGINPSMTGSARDDWDYVGYKGGSEPGVLNLSWLLRDNSAAYYTLVMSWNDPDTAFDKTAFELLAQRAHAAIAKLVD